MKNIESYPNYCVDRHLYNYMDTIVIVDIAHNLNISEIVNYYCSNITCEELIQSSKFDSRIQFDFLLLTSTTLELRQSLTNSVPFIICLKACELI